MLLGVAALTPAAASAVLFYLVAYLMMNLGAFAVVALVRNATGSEQLEAYRGLVWRSPVLAVTMAVFLLALLGLPPLAGFAGKFQVFAALYDAGREASAAGRPDLGAALYALLGVGAVNTAVSAYYYLKVVRAMTLDGPPAGAAPIRVSGSAAAYLTLLAAGLVAVGVVWNPVTRAADRAVAVFAPTTRSR
jgi:NADH-quinone oxidoreductase subunit N